MTRKFHDLSGLCAQLLSQTGTYVVDSVQDAAGDAHGLWGEHQRLMDTNGVYRAVVTSLAGLLGRQLDLEAVVLTVASALIRSFTRPTRPRCGDWDGYPDDDVDRWPA